MLKTRKRSTLVPNEDWNKLVMLLELDRVDRTVHPAQTSTTRIHFQISDPESLRYDVCNLVSEDRLMSNHNLDSVPNILKRLNAVKKEISQIEVTVHSVVTAQADRITELECSTNPFSDCGEAFCNSRSLFNDHDD